MKSTASLPTACFTGPDVHTMSDKNSTLSRRTVLRSTAVAGSIGLAGCNGTEEPNTQTEDEEASGGDTTNESAESGEPEETDQPTNEIELIHTWTSEDNNAAITALIEGFKEQYPDLELSEEPVDGSFPSDLKQVVLNKLRSNDPPSTFQTWPGTSLEIFDDAFEDIEGEVWDEDLQTRYPSGVQEMARYNGSLVTVPINVHRINNLFYNTAILEEAGIDPESLASPSDLVDACQTITEETDAVPFAHQINSGWSTVQLWETILLGQAGITGYEAYIEGTGNRNQVKSALETVVDLTEYYPTDASSLTYFDANKMVVEGEAAFIHKGDWTEGNFSDFSGFEYGEDWNNVPFPGTSRSYLLNMDSFPYVANNPSPIATRRFLSYCGTPEGQVLFSNKKGSIPPRTDADVSSLTEFQQDQFKDYISADNHPPSIQHGLAVPRDAKTAIDAAFDRFIEQYDITDTTDSLMNAGSY